RPMSTCCWHGPRTSRDAGGRPTRAPLGPTRQDRLRHAWHDRCRAQERPRLLGRHRRWRLLRLDELRPVGPCRGDPRVSVPTDINLYINFALHAVLGKLGEADTIMRFAGKAIRRVADDLGAECNRQLPTKPAPLFRGMLLDPNGPFRVDPDLTFLSWSEDRDVALWFACPRSVVSA